MATVTAAPPLTTLPGELFRIPLDFYHRMGELGLLQRSDRVILLDGLLVKKMTKKPRHVTSAQQTIETIATILPAGWYVRKEDPITLPGGPDGADSEPEPDLAIVRGSSRDYADRHPGPADVGLVVEVAERSPLEDRLALGRYAWARIPFVWIINLIDEVVEVYALPSGPSARPSYADHARFGPNDSVALTIDGSVCGAIAVRHRLP